MTDTEVLTRLRELGWNPTDGNPVEIRFKVRGITVTLEGIRRCIDGVTYHTGAPIFDPERMMVVTVVLIGKFGETHPSFDVSEIYAFDKKAEILAEIERYQKEIDALKSKLNE
jgi:hypothetical protein